MDKTIKIIQNSLAGFVPKKLKVKGRPELAIFPLNVLFAGIGLIGDKRVSAHAVYHPDISSFKKEKDGYFMIYKNEFGPESFLWIAYQISKGLFIGEKYVDNKLAGRSSGISWNSFYVHFTAIGVVAGEMVDADDKE